MSRAEAFDEVYRKNIWNPDGAKPSGGGSYGSVSAHYVDVVKDLIATVGARSILDIGTGDFHIGSQLCPLVDRYVGADISAVIVERNRSEYGDRENVEFVHLDACVEELPAADLVLVRQVLQHLNNDEVDAVLRNIDRSGCRYALVGEHLPAETDLKEVNVDLGTHGPYMRTMLGSGVFIDRPPFSRPAQRIASCPLEKGESLTYFLLDYSARQEADAIGSGAGARPAEA